MDLRGWWTESWPTRRSRLLDVSLAVGAAVGDFAIMWAGTSSKFWLPNYVVASLCSVIGLALVFRRRYPVHLALFALIIGTAAGGGPISGLIALYSLGAYAASRWTAVAIAATSYVLFLVVPSPNGDSGSFAASATFGLLFTSFPVILGMYMGARKQLLASLQERASRLEREQHLLAERARSEERTRIAREMHDVVANRVSVMVVHAGALKAVAARDPDRAVQTATVIGDMGRQALEELRQVIGVLRQGEDELATAPTLDDVRSLVGQSGAAGLLVDLVVLGEERPMPSAISRTVYRIVQEALTNVHKHAGGAATRVDVRLPPDAVEVTVVNRPAPEGAAEHGLPSGGNGLVGLRERVVALGGHFEAGPSRDGGFAVRARLPVPTS
ncbi:sensor histidine kinase [Actinomadura rupiterrae]|uniref:sensor histidine kinase n=1 Tax=Actinomadura rupiterrae TaxID=559627 RepID=UPI0020A5C858|nr:histidine kinase [Actinomadura rupiterrae]MCP2338174.1 signal transduction histidine kinase [Actinomadura rupiterrae]